MFGAVLVLSGLAASAAGGRPMPNGPWALTQLVPSPQVALGHPRDGAAFGMRWQITPLLYSFGANRRVSPWRAFIVEPIVRQSGSVELFVSPEYLALPAPAAEKISLRAGARSYFPLLARGEYLSVSMGAAYSSFGRGGVGYEVGAYVLYGGLGLQVTVSPSPDQPPCIVTLRLRYF